MTDIEVFNKLAQIKDFNLLEDNEKFLICDYLHYSIQEDIPEYGYVWGGPKSPYYDCNFISPWGVEVTYNDKDSVLGQILEQLKFQILQERIAYGVLVKVEFLVEENSFCFIFWDCEEAEIDFSKLPDFSCSVNSPEELTDGCVCALLSKKEALKNRLRVIEAEANQLKTEIKNIDNELKKISVSSFEE